MTDILKFLSYNILMPPGCLLILLILGLLCFRWKRLSFTLFLLATIILFLLSLPFVSALLATPLQSQTKALPISEIPHQAQAIVILSGGTYRQPPELGGDLGATDTLGRIHYGAFLYRKTRLPILVTGGNAKNDLKPETYFMARILKEDFRVPVRFIEDQSSDTWQNAKYSAAILLKNHISSILLVTDAIHMPRALFAFRHFGLTVYPAPANFITFSKTTFIFMPSGNALSENSLYLHEYIGILAYRFIYARTPSR